MDIDRLELKKAYAFINKAYDSVNEITWDNNTSDSDKQEAQELMEEVKRTRHEFHSIFRKVSNRKSSY